MEKLLASGSIDGLIRELEKKGGNHNFYYHYTNWDAAQRILQDGTFLLTRGNSMSINDQHEAIMKGAWDVWNRTYIASFSFGTSENMAMWGLYGLPWEDAVRLCIPKREMLRWVNGINRVELWRDGVRGEIAQPEVALTDIVYVDGSGERGALRLTHGQESRTITGYENLQGLDRDRRMTGCIKNYAWHYENEVRLKLCLKRDTGYEKLRVRIPRETVDAITITTGPCFEWKCDPLYAGLCDAGRVRDSGFRNLVRYRPLCSLCAHKQFKRKAKQG